jgi:hypothetical protein
MAPESFTVSVDDASAVPVSPTSSVAVERRADGDNKPDGLHFTRFIIAKTQHYPRDGGDPFSLALDSASPISLIGQKCYERHFATAQTRLAPIPINVSGVGGGQVSTGFAVLELRLRLTDKRHILMSGEFHIIPSLSCNLIVGNDTLHSYHGIIDVGR